MVRGGKGQAPSKELVGLVGPQVLDVQLQWESFHQMDSLVAWEPVPSLVEGALPSALHPLGVVAIPFLMPSRKDSP